MPSEATARMLKACASGDIDLVRKLLREDTTGEAASTQDDATGKSPLMVASDAGHSEICQLLLDAGAPWNAIDRRGQCAGNYATDAEKWEVVNLLVEAGTKAELVLGASIRLLQEPSGGDGAHASGGTSERASADGVDGENGINEESTSGKTEVPVEHEPCTKPDYLQRNVRYNASGTALLDEDDDAVMMEWERPLMEAHASIMTNGTKGKLVLNVGFGMGIIDAALQRFDPSLHVIIEAHPGVHEKMVEDGWDKKPNVRVEFGRWQDVVPKLVEEGVTFDGIFYDTYGEHFTDLEDFHELMAKMLAKPGGVYSFFNGLAPDNIFFHGVACQCVKLQLAKLGLDTEFAQCQIQVKEKEWEGVRRKYWHGRDTYYLPIATWNNESRTGTETESHSNVASLETVGEKGGDGKQSRQGASSSQEADGPECKKLKTGLQEGEND